MAFTTETGFNTTLKQKLDAGGSDTEIALAALPITIEAGVMLIGSGTDKEWVYFGTVDSTSIEIRTCKRGLDKDATATTDVTTSNIKSHRVGDPVRLVQHSLAQNNKPDLDDDNTYTGDNTYEGAEDFQGSLKAPVYATAAARATAIPSPANGMEYYQTDTGKFYDYTGGSWVARESGGTFPNATTTVAGKVEVATEAEAKAGTATGSTGASLLVTPAILTDVIQDNTMLFAADAQANDTYVITLVPAIDAYVTGQRFTFTAKTLNTGAATLNVNGKGAKPIIKGDATALVTGDILAGQVVEVVYDGTSMVMTSLPDMLVAGGEAGAQHYHAIKVGAGSVAVAADGATNIAHGLGRIPKLVTFHFRTGTSVDAFGSWCDGIAYYDGTSQKTIFSYGTGAAANTHISRTDTALINIASVVQFAFTITMDATNIIVTVSSYANPETIYYTWKVE